MATTKRFGARYGTKPKYKFNQIEIMQRTKQKCRSCNRINVKRVAAGIWHCRNCDIKFAGKAYSSV